MSDNRKVVVFANKNPTAESKDFSFGNDNDSASGGSTGNTSSDMNSSSNNGGHVTSGLAKEERWVSMARALVAVVMVAAACIVGVETYRIATKQQMDNFINDVSFMHLSMDCIYGLRCAMTH